MRISDWSSDVCSSDLWLYTVVAIAMLLLFVQITRHVERTRFGMALIAIKQNEAAAEAAGIDTLRWKLKAIALSGAIAGATCAFYAVVLRSEEHTSELPSLMRTSYAVY